MYYFEAPGGIFTILYVAFPSYTVQLRLKTGRTLYGNHLRAAKAWEAGLCRANTVRAVLIQPYAVRKSVSQWQITLSGPAKSCTLLQESPSCSSYISQPSPPVRLLPGPVKGISALSAAKEPAPQPPPKPPIYTPCNMHDFWAVSTIYMGQPDRENALQVPITPFSTRAIPPRSRSELTLAYQE